MAIRLDATGDRLRRTASVPAWGDFSVMLWAYRVSDLGDNEKIFGLCNSGSGAAFGIYCNGATGDVLGVQDPGFTLTDGTGAAWAVGTWRRIAMTFDDTSNAIRLYEGSPLPSAVMREITPGGALTYTGSITIDELTCQFHYLSGGERFNGRYANLKFYTRVLSALEIQRELQSYAIASLANLWGAWPLIHDTDLLDRGPAGRALTSTTVTTEEGPPIPWVMPRARRWADVIAAPAGRTTKNTRAWPLGVEVGMGWRMPA